MKYVAVGSERENKIKAVRLAFEAVWPKEEWKIEGGPYISAVVPQPLCDSESLRGAKTRARSALKNNPSADFGVGIEGGLSRINGLWFQRAWIAVRDKNGKEGVGATISAPVPIKIMQLIFEDGLDISEAVDKLCSTKNIKDAEGYTGYMTKSLFTRAEEDRLGVILALAPWLRPEMF